MKFNFRKITSVLASAIMLGSTIGIAAAANYPAPFISGGSANVAVVVGATAQSSDYLAAVNLGQSLQTELAKQTTTTTATTGAVSGESVELFTGGSKIYINDSLNVVKTTLTKAELPTTLAETTFSGNVDAKLTQTIVLGSNPQVTFAKQPTSSDDPQFGLALSTTQGNYIYNATVDFSKAVNFTHADSKSQELTMFGQKFTVGASTDGTYLILLKSATKLNFDSSGTTSQEVTIEGKKYTIEMVSASTTAATIKVTNEAGASEQKEISEGYSKKVNGVTIAVNTADSNNLKYVAAIVAGAEKVTLQTGTNVKIGESDKTVDGTLVTFTGTTSAMTKLVLSVYASDSDKDAILAGGFFKDPVFGNFKLDFAGLNIDENSTARETISFGYSGDNKLTVTLTDNRGNEKNFQWAINNTDALALQCDDQGHNIVVSESTAVNRSDYVILGNEDEGRLMQIKNIYNDSSTASGDYITVKDVMSGDEQTFYATTEGSITSMVIGGKSYAVTYAFESSLASDSRQIRINSPDSAANDVIVYPTIQTSRGAKIMFYKPLNVSLDNWEGSGINVINNSGNIKIPNGARAYQPIAVARTAPGNITIDGANITTVTKTVAITNTGLSFNFSQGGVETNRTTIYLVAPDGSNIYDPALVLIEEKDDNNQYQATVVTIRPGTTSTTGIGIDDVKRTWGNDARWDAITLASNSYKTKEADLWGLIATKDTSSSAHPVATLSYPDNQVYAQMYIGNIASSVTPSTVGSGTVETLGSVTYKDSELTAEGKAKNLIVVGGSCINTVAAKMLGSETPLCGADFTTKTGVSADQFLVQVLDNPYTTGKVAMLVAGYEAADTTKAVTYVTKEPNVVTDKDTTVKKVTATYADVTTAATTTTA